MLAGRIISEILSDLENVYRWTFRTEGAELELELELKPELKPEPELGSDRGFVCRCGRLVPDERDRQDQGAHGRGGDHPQVNSSFFLFLSISLSLFTLVYG